MGKKGTHWVWNSRRFKKKILCKCGKRAVSKKCDRYYCAGCLNKKILSDKRLSEINSHKCEVCKRRRAIKILNKKFLCYKCR